MILSILFLIFITIIYKPVKLAHNMQWIFVIDELVGKELAAACLIFSS